MVMDSSALQPLNVSALILLIDFERVSFLRDLQPLKILVPISMTESGIVKVVKDLQPLKDGQVHQQSASTECAFLNIRSYKGIGECQALTCTLRTHWRPCKGFSASISFKKAGSSSLALNRV